MYKTITRTDIAEIHEAIATRRSAQTEAERADQYWHAYAAKVLRENDVNHTYQTGYTNSPRRFTHWKPWQVGL